MKRFAAQLAWVMLFPIGMYICVALVLTVFKSVVPANTYQTIGQLIALVGALAFLVLWPATITLAILGKLPGTGKTALQYWLCQKCGYNMRTVPGPLCPECGTEHAIAEQKDR